MTLPGGAPASSSAGFAVKESGAATSAYPRVLVINYRSFNKKFATGITMSNLFADWPRDCLAQVFVNGDGLDHAVCSRGWQLAFQDIRMPLFLHRVTRAYRKGNAATRSVSEEASQKLPNDPSGRSSPAYARTRTSFRSAIISYAMSHAWYGLSGPLRRWIEDFKPEVIYSALEESKITAFVKRVAKTYRIPVIPHFLDDWLTMPMSGSVSQETVPRTLRRNALSMMAEAPVRMAVGDRMAEEYRERYGLTFVPFMNCVEVGSYKAPVRRPGRKFVFAFCGGLHSNRWKLLMDIGHALCELKALNIEAELQVSSGTADEAATGALAAMESIVYLGSLSPDEVATVMSNADCLVHVDAFEDRTKAYMRYSLSAKLPEYFRAGRPILGYGPGDLGSMRYIRETGAGVVVGEQNAGQLRETLWKLIQDEETRLQLGKRAYDAARERHDGARVRKEFRRAIASAVVGRSAKGPGA
jgi:glycosyltransferase involved in cell wall biosynthesis